MMPSSANARPELLLIPNTGVQFVKYSFNVGKLKSFSRPFIERCTKTGVKDGDGNEIVTWRLLQDWNPEDPETPPEHGDFDGDCRYSISSSKALEPFLGKWVPLPFLRINKVGGGIGRETYDDGPTNWVRVRVVANPDRAGDSDPSHIAIFAFDTMIEDSPTSADSVTSETAAAETSVYVPYTEPLAADVLNPRRFALVSNMLQLDRFLSDVQSDAIQGTKTDYQKWVVDWQQKLFHEFLEALRGRRLRAHDIEHNLEHVARWIAFVDLLDTLVTPPRVRFVNTLGEQPAERPVDIDLILDVGNSRTCGILIEDYPSQLEHSFLTLKLRDLAEPEKVYDEPFQSHVEFAQAWFGPEELSRNSTRTRAFFWPTPVRVGPEAKRIRDRNGSNDSLCGLSSPKRYLWDLAEANQPWRFPENDYVDDTPPPISRNIKMHLNSTGDVLSRVKKDRKLYQSLYPGRSGDDLGRRSQRLCYSRSSLYTFMLAEVIWQAFVMINNPQVRDRRSMGGLPRRLRRIYLTLPTSVPTREQRIMKARAESAISLIFDTLGWSKRLPRGTEMPQVEVSWDEASCVQTVWLYSEISRKYGGNIDGYLSLVGRQRQFFTADHGPAPGVGLQNSLRVASIDVGGGTTDLMITTYFHRDNRAIVPVQTFRESFRIAGDDISRAVIERLVVPALINHLEGLGERQAKMVLSHLFVGDRADMSVQETTLRRQYVQRVLLPTALRLMSAYEDMTPHDYLTERTEPLGQFVPEIASVSPATRAYLEANLNPAVAERFRLEDVPVVLSFETIRRAIRETMGAVLDNLSEAIHHFDCDVVVVSGRPSKLPAVLELLTDGLAMSPDRLVAMHRYSPGSWYPFSDAEGRIGDPKTTAAVGAMICVLARNRLPNFMVYVKELQMRSTAKYIGELETDGSLTDQKILFSPADMVSGNADSVSKTLSYYTESTLGYRQLPHARWIASPFYRLHHDTSGGELQMPITVTLKRTRLDDEDEPGSLLERESAKEELVIEEAQDGNQATVKPAMRLSLRTMPFRYGFDYWLDTGRITIV